MSTQLRDKILQAKKMDKRIGLQYFEDCPDYKLDLYTGECMFRVGMFSCVNDKYQSCYRERR